VELGSAHSADAPQPFDWEGVKEGQLAVQRHDEQTVGLGHGAGHLGEELGPGDADRDGQTDPLEHVDAQPRRDRGGRAVHRLHPADVEERLVDRQPLDQGCRLPEHLEDRLTRLGIG
jgi:hypothetical protein